MLKFSVRCLCHSSSTIFSLFIILNFVFRFWDKHFFNSLLFGFGLFFFFNKINLWKIIFSKWKDFRYGFRVSCHIVIHKKEILFFFMTLLWFKVHPFVVIRLHLRFRYRPHRCQLPRQPLERHFLVRHFLRIWSSPPTYVHHCNQRLHYHHVWTI